MLQITYGLLCAPDGCPIAIEVFDGDTADPMTLAGAEAALPAPIMWCWSAIEA